MKISGTIKPAEQLQFTTLILFCATGVENIFDMYFYSQNKVILVLI